MDAVAFERALRPLLRRSGAYAASILHDRKMAEDAVQQAALRAWERRSQFDASRSFSAWWFAILRNQSLDVLRQAKRRPAGASLDEVAAAVPADEGVLDRRALKAAMETLPEGQREVLKLRYFADLSYAEIARVLDIPNGTVMSRLHLARQGLAVVMRTEER
jgi:RNA polymerase sigma-70 factor (ECF subfamily)